MRRRLALVAGLLAFTGCSGGTDPLEQPNGQPPAANAVPTPPPVPFRKLRAVYQVPANRSSPRAVVILIHGGGWRGPNRGEFRIARGTAQGILGAGYATYVVEYNAGARGIKDVQRFYRRVRQELAPGVPVCALGSSAGGHVALMLAAREPALACVLALAGPTDLEALGEPGGGAVAFDLAVAAFGEARLRELSPVTFADRIRAKVFLAYAQTDTVVPPVQGRRLAEKLSGTELLVLPPGENRFVHSGVSSAASTRLLEAETAFLDGIATAAGR